MTTETRYINEIQQDSPIIFLEKATDGKVSLEDISKALDEYERLYKAGFATPAELLTLSRAYPENDEYSKALQKMGIGDDDSLVIGGPASIELIDREGHLITTKALEPAFEKYMANIRNRNVMVLHSDVQVGWALPAYISSEGSIFKSGVDDTGLFFIAELRNDTKISKKVRDQISSGEMKSYSIAGSALKTQTIEKGLLKVMQVDELELAEVTICEKGVNQEAGFEILKGDNVPTKSCSDGSCLTKMQECECQNATPEVETKPIAHKPMQLLTKKDGKPDYFASLQKWINKGSVNGEDFDYSDAGLQEAIDYATGLMMDKKKVVFEWEDYKKGFNNMTTKDSLLKLAVEVLKELPRGAVYADANTPSDAIQPNPSGRGRGHWFPEQYAAQKEKEKTKVATTSEEGMTAAEMGAKREDNPYTKAKNKMRSGEVRYNEGDYAALMDLESKWDSGFSQGYQRAKNKGKSKSQIESERRAANQRYKENVTAGKKAPDTDLTNKETKEITVGAIKQTVPYTPKEKLVPYKRDVYDSLEKRGYTEDEIYFVLRMFTDKPTRGNWEDGIPNATQLKSIVSTGIYGVKNAKDQANVGTNKYKGIAYFHDREYKYQMRGASNKQRREAHKKLLAAGLDPSGKSDKHYEIITSVVEDSLPW